MPVPITRRRFTCALLATPLARALCAQSSLAPAERLVVAARAQIGITNTYDPRYASIAYPNGDLPRSTGVCADVVVRAYRDAFALDLQKLVHEDMTHDFAAYPHLGAHHPDSNIDHRRVLNLEVFWKRKGACLWSASAATAGDALPPPLRPGDLVTWLLGGRLPHIAVVSDVSANGASVVHNIGRGAEELPLSVFHNERAKGHYRWLPA